MPITTPCVHVAKITMLHSAHWLTSGSGFCSDAGRTANPIARKNIWQLYDDAVLRWSKKLLDGTTQMSIPPDPKWDVIS